MFIFRPRSTPTPATLKFLPGQTVLEMALPIVPRPRSRASGHRPWPRDLFAVEGVTGVFLGH